MSASIIVQMVENQEDAIRETEPEKWERYIGFSDAYLEHTQWVLLDPSEGDTEMGEHIMLVGRYLMSSSYLGAHAYLRGNKTDVDKAAKSFSTLCSSLGYSPLDLFNMHLEAEIMWRRVLLDEIGVFTYFLTGCGRLLLSCLRLLLFLLFWGALAYFAWAILF